MDLAFRSVLEFGLRPSAELLTRAFADYIVSIALDEERLAHMARLDGLDLTLSRVIYCDGTPAGAALIARRGWTSRLAAMALVPEARRRGVGTAVMACLMDEARQRGDRRMVLEVIEQNAPAVRLYDRCGFQRVRRLVGFRADPTAAAEPAPLVPVDPREVAAAVAALPPAADLPWQLSAETIAQLSPPSVGYRNGHAWAAVSTPAGPIVRLRALAAGRHLPGAEGAAADLLRAIRAAHPAHPCEVISIWPEERSEPFLDAGFAQVPLSQFQLTHDLGERGTAGPATPGMR